MGRLRPIAVTSAIALVFGTTLVSLGASPAMAASPTTLTVSPTGSGTACSTSSPCSIAQAQSSVESIEAGSPTGDVVVALQAGTYRLTSPLSFGAADGGRNGTKVLWESAPGGTAVLTGASRVTGWSSSNVGSGVYVATVPTGLDTRDLYVNGQTASRASISISASDIALNSTGFTIKNSALNYLANLPEQNRIELEANSSFTDRYAPVSSISGTTVTMAQPAWNNNLWGYDTLQNGALQPDRYQLDNSLSFLTQANQWYIDPTAGKLYYKPASGVDPSTLDVELPQLQSLVSVGGTYASPVSNLAFSGIQFSGTSWLGPSSNNGYADQQNGTFMTGAYSYEPSDAFSSCSAGCAAFERARSTWHEMPAAVQVSAADHVSFDHNTFTGLGQRALGVGQDADANTNGVGLGASFVDITDNVFTNDGGGAVAVGGISADAHHPSDLRMTNHDVVIQNNTVDGVATNYKDNSGILSTYVTRANIVHNEVENMPYDGIDTGWGWGINDAGGSPDYQSRGYYQYNPEYSTPTTLSDNVISYNLVHDVKQDFGDGGGIYNLSSSPGTTIDDNYIYNDSSIGLYLDEGSRYISLESNVVSGANNWAHFNTYSNNYTDNNTLDNTYHNAGTLYGEFDSNTGNVNSNDHTVSGTAWPTAAQQVICSAGVAPGLRTSLNVNYSASGYSTCTPPLRSIGTGFLTTGTTAAQTTFGQTGSQFAISAAGSDMWGAGGEHADAYGAIYQSGVVSAGTTVTARVDDQNDLNPWAKTGVIIRNAMNKPGSSTGYAVVAVTPGNGVSFQWDSSSSGYLDQEVSVPADTALPIWVRLVRTGSQIAGYYSYDGATYHQVGSTVALTGANATEDGGVFSTSHDSGNAQTNLISNLQFSNGVTSPLTFSATGNAQVAQNGTAVTLGGSGADVWSGGAEHWDSSATLYKPQSFTNGTSVTAEVLSQGDTNSWAKAGVVIRNWIAQQGVSAGYAILARTPGNGLSFQWDSNGDGYLDSLTTVSNPTTGPVWLRLTETAAGQVSAYESTNGSTYTQIGTAETLPGAAATEDAGLLTTSHDPSTYATASFSGLTIG